ncbi:ABC transporter substrate-binding protein [Thermococcus sp. Bubb.Bath]|nr:helical backbone metal receptor [Thermococcus sp. Bubb.Bath]NJF25474.1 ABC transporter substrate-binding protein [Thermococcus sp. Bubb.Bath]
MVFAAGCIGGNSTQSSTKSSPAPSTTSSKVLSTTTSEPLTSSTTITATSSSSSTTTSSSSSQSPTTTTSASTTTSSTSTQGYYPITIKDDLNRTVTITKEPERVVTLAPFITEDLYYLGLFDRVVGVTNYDDFPPAVANVSRVGGYGKYANLELIANLSPDLIIADTYSQPILSSLEKIAPVIVVRAHTMDDVSRVLELLGKVFNCEDKAKEVVTTFQAKVNEISSTVKDEPKVKVFYVVWGNPLMTAGGDSFISSLISLAGGINVFNDTTGWPSVSDEQVLARNPDVIILTPHCGMSVEDAFKEFAGTSAAANGKIYMIENENDLIHPSPRLLIGLETLAKLLHPDAFKEKYPLTITDFENRTVTIRKEPQRIVSLAPSITETLFYLGAGNKLVGVTDYADWPAAVNNITRIGGYGKYANLELIANLSPDLIIADDFSLPILDQLEKIAPVIIVAPKDIDGIYRQIELLGEVTNRKEQADLVIGEMKGEISYVESKVANLTRPRVFFILSAYGGEYWTAGKDTFVNDIIDIAGGKNIFDDISGWGKPSEEQVLARDPEVIILLPTAGINASQLCDGPFASTTAVQTGRIYTPSNADPYLRPSPRIIEAIDEMARFLHPEAFGLHVNSTVCKVATSTG